MASISVRQAQLVVAAFASVGVGLFTVHCGSDSSTSSSEGATTGTDASGTTSSGDVFIDVEVKDYSVDQFLSLIHI